MGKANQKNLKVFAFVSSIYYRVSLMVMTMVVMMMMTMMMVILFVL